MNEQLAKITEALKKYKMTAAITGDKITITDSKNRIAGYVKGGDIERVKSGNQQLMGSLIRDDIKAAIV